MLSSTIQRFGDRLDQLRGEVATLRNRQAIVQAELEQKEAQLKQDKTSARSSSAFGSSARSRC